MSDVSLRDRVAWTEIALVVAGVAIVVWAYRARHESQGDFPDVIITAQGVLVTAVVFFLTLARSQHERSLDRIVKEERDHDVAILNAHIGAPSAMPVVRLRQIADERDRHLEAMIGLSKKSISELIPLPRYEKRLAAADREAIGVEFAKSQLEAKLRELGYREEHAAERRKVEAEIRRREEALQEVKKRQDALVGRLGGSRSGARVFVARSTDPLTTALRVTARLLLVARGMLFLIVILYGIGAGIANWRPNLTPGAEWWAMTILLIVAVVYVAAVRVNIESENSRLSEELESLPLRVLERMENVLPRDSDIRESDRGWGYNREAMRTWRFYEASFNDVANRFPTVGWVRGLRGRELLWQGLQELAHLEVLERVYEHYSSASKRSQIEETRQVARNLIETAVAELQAAAESGDPAAQVALAAALEQRSAIGLGSRAEADTSGAELVESAVALLGQIDGWTGFMIRNGIQSRSWTWPEDTHVRRALQRLDGFENASAPTVRTEAGL